MAELKRSTKIGTISSTVLWLIGFVLLFVFKPGDQLVFLSDTFLLIGFWPLLYIWKAGWPWIVFGCLNMFIGFFLELSKFLPTEVMTPDMLQAYEQAKEHMISMHPCLVWILIGALSILFGLFRVTKTVWRFCRSKTKSEN